ncbi:MAG: DNA translocase FtsK 4TM domain-containing protein [Deltaproteobacteria bacterium]|jgi:S-DNA-T family DNA segregation ATPase FtsK/SpoIIIE|nr:DNA translocase FtsK 4TM domain-containing protein [Deltaproteobacteria bacterium]
MARKRGKKAPPKVPWIQRLPPEVPGLLALLLSVLVVLSLISHSPEDGEGVLARNYIGAAGVWGSGLLIKFFGILAFWPAPVLFWGSYYILKNPGQRTGLFSSTVGILLILFAFLAMAGLLWPSAGLTPFWPEAPGGGILGAFLAQGLLAGLGRIGGLLVAPFLALGGLMLLTGLSPRNLRKIPCFFGLLWRWLPKAPAKTDKSEPKLKIRPVARRGGQITVGSEANDREIVDLTDPDPGLSVGGEDPSVPEKPALVFREKKKKIPPKTVPKTESGIYPASQYVRPDLNLLDPVTEGGYSGLSEEEMTANARLLEKKLKEFQVEGQVTGVSWGPVITQYEFQPAPGIKIGKVTRLAEDLTMALKTTSCRVTGAIPGKGAIGLELPNPNRQLVTMREVVESAEYQNSTSPLSLALGVDITGQPVIRDLMRMPHLLIAGATNSGKSVCLDSLLMSIFYKSTPEEVRFLLIDPKCVELTQYNDLPHLLYPVLTDPEEATMALKWAVSEMDARYRLMAETGVRQISKYNEQVKKELLNWKPKAEDDTPPKTLPYLVIIIDELSDLMLTAAKEVEVSISRLAAKARAAGIHLILATQRPSVDVLTGVIKANLPTRISFQVSSKIDSRTILDRMGAEQLLGKGDMLFQTPGANSIERLHGTFVSDEEKKRVTDYIRQYGPPDYLENLIPPERGGEENTGDRDDKYSDALELVRQSGKASSSFFQRRLGIGYPRAARIIEDMERDGYIGPQEGSKPRAILFS